MIIKSRLFGEVEIEDDKILTFENGLIGFDKARQFTIIFNSENGDNRGVMWLQSVDDADLAFPVIDPTHVYQNYNPVVEDEWLEPIGHFDDVEELYVLAVLTVPSDLTRTTANLKAPVIINTTTRKGCQIIASNDEYEIKYNVYEFVQQLKKEESQC